MHAVMHALIVASERSGIDGHALAGWFWMLAGDPLIAAFVGLVSGS
jgi:hypothetical protein